MRLIRVLSLALQLRNLVWSTSKHDVYLMSHFSIVHWSSLSSKRTEVLDVSGHVAPCEVHLSHDFFLCLMHGCCEFGMYSELKVIFSNRNTLGICWKDLRRLKLVH